MAKKQSARTEGLKPKKSRKIPLVLVGIMLLIALAAGGGVTYTTYFQSDYPKKILTHVDLDDAALRFIWTQIPDVYGHMVSTNAELDLMENEIHRINGVRKKYPRQDKIASSEIMRWEKSVKKLSRQLHRFQSQVEALYVTFRVNPEKGRSAIDEKRTDLTSAMQEVLSEVEIQTAPLKAARRLPRGFKGVMEKFKRRFF